MGVKVCCDCKLALPRGQFSKNKSTADGLNSLCKRCNVIRATAWAKANPDKANKNKRRWAIEHPSENAAAKITYAVECHAQIRAAANLRRAADPSERERERWYEIERAYGLARAQWEAMFATQNYRCACCGSVSPGSKHAWHTEHDHVTGKVRGITCQQCNIMLGGARDSIEILLAGVRYLEKANAQNT